MLNITIEYGTGNTFRGEFPEGTTLQEVLADPLVKGALGYGANVEPHVDGVPQPVAAPIAANDVVEVHDRAASKAAR